MATSALNWFEIIAADLGRAARFYETALGLPAGSMHRHKMGDGEMAMFPADEQGVGGAIWHCPQSKPSAEGTKVYLNCNGKLDDVLARVSQAGGAVVMPKTVIGSWGYMALIRDTEGNVVGLHSV